MSGNPINTLKSSVYISGLWVVSTLNPPCGREGNM